MTVLVQVNCAKYHVGVVRQQAITRANVNKYLSLYMVSLGHNELMQIYQAQQAIPWNSWYQGPSQ